MQEKEGEEGTGLNI